MNILRIEHDKYYMRTRWMEKLEKQGWKFTSSGCGGGKWWASFER